MRKNSRQFWHRNGILRISLAGRSGLTSPQPIRIGRHIHFQPAHFPFDPQKDELYRGQFVVWPRVLIIILIKQNHQILLKFDLFQEETLTKRSGYGYYPTNGIPLTFDARRIQTSGLSKDEAFKKAVEIIMEDPRFRICEISLAADKFAIRCWKASANTQMTFQSEDGERVLFYSTIIFKWKVPDVV